MQLTLDYLKGGRALGPAQRNDSTRIQVTRIFPISASMYLLAAVMTSLSTEYTRMRPSLNDGKLAKVFIRSC